MHVIVIIPSPCAVLTSVPHCAHSSRYWVRLARRLFVPRLLVIRVSRKERGSLLSPELLMQNEHVFRQPSVSELVLSDLSVITELN